MRRGRIFTLGLLVSIALIAIFIGGAGLQVSLTGAGPGRLNWAYRGLVALFLILNPLFTLVGYSSLALPASFTASRIGQTVLVVVYLVAFVGGWWLVGTLVERLTVRRRRDA